MTSPGRRPYLLQSSLDMIKKARDLRFTPQPEQTIHHSLNDTKSMAPPEAVLASLVCTAVTRLSMFSGPRATDNRILNLLLSTLFFFFFFFLKKNAGCLSVYHCMKGPPTYCLRSICTRIKNETT